MNQVCFVLVTPPTPLPTDMPGFCPGTEWITKGRYCYYFNTGSSEQWSQAEFDCVQRGGHLASVGDSRENQWLYSQLTAATGFRDMWLGLRKTGTGKKHTNTLSLSDHP